MENNGNQTESNMVNIPAAHPKAPAKASPGRPKKLTKKRMVYGFAFSMVELQKWGKQKFGDTDDEKVLRTYIRRSIGHLHLGCRRLWHRTTKVFVTYYSGPRRYESDWCLVLADNISRDTVTPPPRDIIDKIKEDLCLTKDPQWHVYYGA